MRHHRVIQLDDPPEPARLEPANGAAAGSWVKLQMIRSPPDRGHTRDFGRQDGYEKRWREDDVLCIERQVTSEIPGRYGTEDQQEYSLRRVPAHVDFGDIREAATFEIDEGFSERPWDHCDGYAHHELDERDLYHEALQVAKPRGFYRGSDHGLLVLDDIAEYVHYDYHRRRGASKQVARELAAVQCRRILDQLVEWYTNGWWWYEAACEFEGYEDSLAGFLSMDEEQYACGEVASTVAQMMQEGGYTILNWPDAEERRVGNTGCTVAEYRKRLQQNLNEQNWSYP